MTLVSCERGALRQSSEGVFIYDEQGRTEVMCTDWQGPLRVELGDYYQAVNENRPAPHDGRWGNATLEVCLAILMSSREGREQHLAHQVASPYCELGIKLVLVVQAHQTVQIVAEKVSIMTAWGIHLRGDFALELLARTG